MNAAEIRMLVWMCRHTRKDKIRNEDLLGKMGVASVVDKIREAILRLFGHMKRRNAYASVRRCEWLPVISLRRGRGRPRKNWEEAIRHDARHFQLI